MVNVMIIIPYNDTREFITRRLRKIRDKDISIDVSHVYGTSDWLGQYDDKDILVARGMTCAALRRLYPQKHIIEINMTSFDVLEALATGKRQYNASTVAVCVHSSSLLKIPIFEELTGMKLYGFDMSDDAHVDAVIEEGRRLGADLFIGGLTLARRCIELDIPYAHVKTSEHALSLAVDDMVNTARTLNQERVKTNMISLVLNNAPDSILAVDTHGRIIALNNQAHTLLRIPITDNIIGKNLGAYCPEISWRDAVEKSRESERLQQLFGKLYYIRSRPILVDEQCVGVLVTVLDADKIQAAETKIRKELSTRGLTSKYSFEDIIGISSGMKACISTAKKYSQVDANVLLVGETGTGKELFAHSIHNASKRRDQPFVAINCAALPESLLESELFGYVEGAFSGAVKGGKIGLFELAHKGTIFLDEIGELPSALQAKLLRVLREREVRRVGDDRVYHVDVRVISATNIDINAQIAEKSFRSDLYYRLDILRIELPPLCRRRPDILVMADFFLKRFAIQYGKLTPRFDKQAVELIESYPWPGNGRELRNFCERLIVLSESETVDDKLLKQLGLEALEQPEPKNEAFAPKTQEELLSLISRPNVKKEELAKMLGVSRSTLWRWSKKL